MNRKSKLLFGLLFGLLVGTALTLVGCGGNGGYSDNNTSGKLETSDNPNNGGSDSILIPSSLAALFGLFKLENPDNIETSGADNGGLSNDTLTETDDKEAS